MENLTENYLPQELLTSPEGKLKRLNDCLFKLYAETFSQSFLKKQNFEMNLIPLLRRTVTAQLLSEKRFIAVTGAQGAGKSTFVQNLLGLEQGVLVTNPGRGERFPLFITQTQSTDFERVVKYISNSSDVPTISDRLIENTAEGLVEWDNIQRGKDESVLLAELKIPSRFLTEYAKEIFDQVQGIMLLPGYVLPNEENDQHYFITLMRDSLAQADHAVVVTSQSDLANRITSSILEDLRKRLPGVKPVVVISSAEFISDQDRAILKSDAIAKFDLKMPDGSTDTENWSPVIFTPNVNGSAALAKEVADAIQATYHPNLEIQRDRQLQSLYVLLKNIQTLLQDMASFIEESRLLSPGGVLEKMSNEYSEFNSSLNKLRSEYSASLKESLKGREKLAIKEARSEYRKEYEGFVNKFKSQIRSASREIDKYEELLERACSTAMHHGDEFGLEHAKFVGEIVEQRLRVLGKFDQLDTLGSQSEGVSPFMQDLSLLLSAEDNLGDNFEISVDYLDAVRALPIVTLMMSDTFWSTSTFVWKQSNPELNDKDFLEHIPDFESFSGRLEHMSQAQKRVLTAIGSILLADVAADGTVNSIPALAHGIHSLIYGSASTSGTAAGLTVAGMSVAGVVAASVGAILVAKAMHSQIKLADRKQIENIELNVIRIFEAYSEAYLQALDDMMSHLREFYLMRLNKRYHVDLQVIGQIRLDKKVSDARLAVDEMLQEVPVKLVLSS